MDTISLSPHRSPAISTSSFRTSMAQQRTRCSQVRRESWPLIRRTPIRQPLFVRALMSNSGPKRYSRLLFRQSICQTSSHPIREIGGGEK
jgi:hypothetical protein